MTGEIRMYGIGEGKPASGGNIRDPDPINHPYHYTSRGTECIDIAEDMSFCLGNALKYIWRAGLKGDAVTDLRKAAWYLNREIQRLSQDQ